MYRYSLTPRIRADLDALDALKAEPLCTRPMSERYTGRLRRELEAGAVAGSVSIEGVSVTTTDALCVLAGSPPPGVSAEKCPVIDAYREAYSWALLHAGEPHFVWRERFVLEIHRRLVACAARETDITGYRDKQVYLGDVSWGSFHYEPPRWHLVPLLVAEVCEWLEGHGEHPAVVASLAHIRLAGIHPFVDGNGRLARIVAAAVMVEGGFDGAGFLGLEQWWGGHRSEYYRAFGVLGAGWDADADVTGFVEAHVGAQREHAGASRDAIRIECAVYEALEQVVSTYEGLDPCSVDALHDALLGRSVTVPLYRAFAGVTEAVARRDLARLEGEGLLLSCDGVTGRVFTRTRLLLDQLAAHAGIAPEIAGDGVRLGEYALRIVSGIAGGPQP